MKNPSINGLCMMDYFAAHAPAEPQAWFAPVMPTARPKDHYVGEDGTDYGQDGRRADREVGEDLFSNVNWDAQLAWDAEYFRQRCIQWPWAWAREMMAQSLKHGDDEC